MLVQHSKKMRCMHWECLNRKVCGCQNPAFSCFIDAGASISVRYTSFASLDSKYLAMFMRDQNLLGEYFHQRWK